MSVESTVGTKGNIVLGKNIRGEEVAGLVAAVLSRVLLVVGSLGLASSSAEARVVRVVVEELHAGVCVVFTIERSVDGSRKCDTSVEMRDGRKTLGVLGVTVRTNNDNVEGFTVGILGTAPLAFVGSSLRGNVVTVDRALHVGERGGVGAGRSRVHRRVTLVVDVEAQAVLLRVAEVSTCLDIVLARIDVLVGEVADLLGTASLVLERLCVTIGCFSCQSIRPQDAVRVGIIINATKTRLIASTTGLRGTAIALVDALSLDNSGSGGGSSGRVVRDSVWCDSRKLGTKDRRSRNVQNSVDVNQLGSGGDSAEDGGSNKSVTHLEGCLFRSTEDGN